MSGSSGTSGYSGTSGSSGSSGSSGTSGGSFTYAVSGASYSTSNTGLALLSTKKKSAALNVNNMEGIELRKIIKSNKMKASQCA